MLQNLFYKVLSFQTQTYKPLKLFFSGLNYGRKLTPYRSAPVETHSITTRWHKHTHRYTNTETQTYITLPMLQHTNRYQAWKRVRGEKGEKDIIPLGGSGVSSPGRIFLIFCSSLHESSMLSLAVTSFWPNAVQGRPGLYHFGRGRSVTPL